ncbi:MAG: TlpA disulfide reductase family protein [Rikenellaceae bacterium]
MNIKHIAVAAVLIAAAACTTTPKVAPNEFLVEAEVANLPEGAEMVLYYGRKQLVDTIQNGRFQFRDTISIDKKEEVKVAIMARRSATSGISPLFLEIWVSPGSYSKISGDGIYLSEWQIRSKSPMQRGDERYKESIRKEALLLEYLMVKRNSGVVYSGEESYDIGRQIDTLRKHMSRNAINYFKGVKCDYYWLSRVHQLAQGFIHMDEEDLAFTRADIVELADRIPESMAEETLAQEIRECLVEIPTADEGDKMIDGTLYDLQGNKRTLSEFAGRYILIDFWAHWCGPCVSSIPEMKEIAEMYKDRLTVVSISSDSEEKWKSYCAENEIGGNQWNELVSQPILSRNYKVRGIPCFVLISPDGVLLNKWVGYSGSGVMKSRLSSVFGDNK